VVITVSSLDSRILDPSLFFLDSATVRRFLLCDLWTTQVTLCTTKKQIDDIAHPPRTAPVHCIEKETGIISVAHEYDQQAMQQQNATHMYAHRAYVQLA
jgi:hypothetical protein